MTKPEVKNRTSFAALSKENWKDFEELFGSRGACGGCWCMSWRLDRGVFKRQKGAGNKAAMRSRVKGGHTPGILLYKNGRAVGWCSVAPRQEFVALERSRVWKPVDDRPVWSISCFFVAKEHRGQGLSVELIRSAVSYARQQGAKMVEGYPQELTGDKLPAPFVWTGLASAYRQAGFIEVLRRSKTKPIMRYEVGQ